MRRLYGSIIEEHFAVCQQMLFLMGPRQVGKTFVCSSAQTLTKNFNCLNWDNKDHRNIILSGPTKLADYLGLQKSFDIMPIVVFDELHKYGEWKNYLKGFYDSYKDQIRIIVTGSAKLNVYKHGGDSLMGRYFYYRIHPISVAENLRITLNDSEIATPQPIPNDIFDGLYKMGGFPEPFLKNNPRFTRRWKNIKLEQLFREDIRDLCNIHEIALLEFLAQLLKNQAGHLVNYSNLASKVGVSVDTIKRWIATLEKFYYCFSLKPWSRNVTRSLLKEPKIYLWDWSEINDIGAKTENFVASHLLKAIHLWIDRGLGEYQLFFIRDKDKNEVDFLVTKN
ncbi:MAG: ATP-binding protein, partial [Gammaproteobacteria bacterium]|nr:ATP-binding protein [Gammaproteobacteria bacterium]